MPTFRLVLLISLGFWLPCQAMDAQEFAKHLAHLNQPGNSEHHLCGLAFREGATVATLPLIDKALQGGDLTWQAEALLRRQQTRLRSLAAGDKRTPTAAATHAYYQKFLHDEQVVFWQNKPWGKDALAGMEHLVQVLSKDDDFAVHGVKAWWHLKRAYDAMGKKKIPLIAWALARAGMEVGIYQEDDPEYKAICMNGIKDLRELTEGAGKNKDALYDSGFGAEMAGIFYRANFKNALPINKKNNKNPHGFNIQLYLEHYFPIIALYISCAHLNLLDPFVPHHVYLNGLLTPTSVPQSFVTVEIEGNDFPSLFMAMEMDLPAGVLAYRLDTLRWMGHIERRKAARGLGRIQQVSKKDRKIIKEAGAAAHRAFRLLIENYPEHSPWIYGTAARMLGVDELDAADLHNILAFGMSTPFYSTAVFAAALADRGPHSGGSLDAQMAFAWETLAMADRMEDIIPLTGTIIAKRFAGDKVAKANQSFEPIRQEALALMKKIDPDDPRHLIIARYNRPPDHEPEVLRLAMADWAGKDKARLAFIAEVEKIGRTRDGNQKAAKDGGSPSGKGDDKVDDF